MMKISIAFLLMLFVPVLRAQQIITSPDKNISVEIKLTDKIHYNVSYKGEVLIQDSPMSVTMLNTILGTNPRLQKSTVSEVDEKIEPLYGNRKIIRDHYNKLRLDFKGGYSVEFRAYDNGIAYRFDTRLRDKQVVVKNEEVSFNFNGVVPAWMLNSRSYETGFDKVLLDVANMQKFNLDCKVYEPVMDSAGRCKIFLPLVVQASPTAKVMITEAGLHEYPALFIDLEKSNSTSLAGTFEKYAISTKPGGYQNFSLVADSAADYIAVTSGTRKFPWRLMIISDNDRTFPDCDLVYQLSDPCELKETDWIMPGKVVWDWWHDYAVAGHNFIGGVNTATYLHHIDFAAKYKIEYLLIDAGALDPNDLTKVTESVDLKKIVDYADGKDVKVMIWLPSRQLLEQMDPVFDFLASIGIAGVKIDFFGSEEQNGIRLYEDIARAAAERKLLVDFHGSTKPTGLSRTFPNIINYEAVAGNEWNKLDFLDDDKITISYRVTLPFIRGVQGPMDFTPGGMRNLQSGFNLRYTLPSVHGTRSGEAALFVLYNEPLKMLCDAPFVYEKEHETTEFISKIPTVWDDTRVLEASFGDYLVEARQTGKVWYVAGLTGDKSTEVMVDFSFLGEGSFNAIIMKDGPNAGVVGVDYILENLSVDKTSKLKFNMAVGGGFVIRID